ncbi:hypothetical protein [Ralstonia mannitolilytica]|uniref:hypothetical protein n=1 Tax=Ralstonia mannitolilytica TaxID=105219 RepID=UPI000699013E|nr:hypothetical protein [Ralstonia mannitolilytica]
MSTGISTASDDVLPGSKDPSIAGLLSFLCAGAGQLYNGEPVKAAAMFFPLLLLGLLLGWGAIIFAIPVIFYGVYDASKVAKTINARIREDIAKKQQEDEAQASIEKSTVSVHDLVEQIDKLRQLATSGLLNQNEFNERKAHVLSSLESKKPRESAEDFLAALIPLVKSEALSPEEINRIKAFVF